MARIRGRVPKSQNSEEAHNEVLTGHGVLHVGDGVSWVVD